MSRHLLLYAPGLLGPWPSPAASDRSALPELPGLTAILQAAQSSPTPNHDPEAQTLAWFGWDPRRKGDLPIAALEQGADEPGYWLKADPVILHPDRDRLLLFDGAQTDYAPDETQALIAAMNEHFQPLGWRFREGYLRLSETPGFTTTPLRHALGRSVDRLLPRGPDATRLHGHLTELEMLLHAHPVNQQRQLRGRATVDGVWLWGGGEQPVLPMLRDGPFQQVFDDRLLMKRLADPHCEPIPADWPALRTKLAEGDNLLTLMDLDRIQTYGDTHAWLERLPILDERWFQPLLEAYETRQIASLSLLAGNGRRYVLTSRSGLRPRLSRLLRPFRKSSPSWERHVSPGS